MPLSQPTKEFLKYLHCQPAVRRRLRAAPGKTLLYAGSRGATMGHKFGFQSPMWRDISRLKASDPHYADKEILHEVLARTAAPQTPYPSLLQYVQEVERRIAAVPSPQREMDYSTLWRALSGIFASNAEGAVSIALGSGVTDKKVFVSTELHVLLRNSQVDQETRDLLAYFGRCIERGETAINLSVIRA